MEHTNENNMPKIPSQTVSYIFLIIAMAIGALSGIVGANLIFNIIAITLASVSFLSLSRASIKRILVMAAASLLVSTAISASVCLIISGKFVFSSLSSAIYAPVALTVALSVYKLKTRLFTETISTVILFLLYIALLAAVILDLYGKIDLSVFNQLESDIKNYLSEVISAVNQSYIEAGATQLIGESESENFISNILIYFKLFLPSIFFLMSMVTVHISTGIFRRILLGFYFGKIHLSDWYLYPSVTSASVYLISIVAVTVFETVGMFSESSIITAFVFGFGNLALITLIPSCSLGFRQVIANIKARRPQTIFSIAILIMVLCCNPALLPIFLAISGSVNFLTSVYTAKKSRQ